MAFIVVYFFSALAAALCTGALLASTSIRNRSTLLIASMANVIASPFATVAEEIRDLGTAAIAIIPDTAFAPGCVRRMLYLSAFLTITLVEISLAAGRLAVAFGIEEQQLPINVSWASALGWIAVSGLWGAISLELRESEIGHPWDRLTTSGQRLLRRLSDICFVITLLSGLAFWVWGAYAAANVYLTLLVVVFMGLLGVSLVAGTAVSFFASADAWVSAWGVILVVASIVLRFYAILFWLVVVVVRYSARSAMAAQDVFFLGLARPLLLWWSSSRMGKALGHPPIEEPIEWPEIGETDPLPEAQLDAKDEPERIVQLPRYLRRRGERRVA